MAVSSVSSSSPGIWRVLLLVFCIAGIFSAYLTQGIFQEILSIKKFGPDGRRFQHLPFLNFAQNVVCFMWSLLMILIWNKRKERQAPLWVYWSPSITNSIGPACGIQALKYISYPAQVLVKSSKMIPVMLIGTLVYGVRYTLPEYICTFLVAGGVSVFAFVKSRAKAVASPNAPLGYLLCFLNLGLDGFTNATQDSISSRYPQTSAWHIMLGMNLWGSIFSFLYMFAWNGGGGFEAVQFCREHPDAAWDIMIFCLCGAVGQNFIFLTISKFGSLALTTITTTRKFASILVSSIWTGSPLSAQQWSGVTMVFAGLSVQIYLKWQRQKQRSAKKVRKS